MMMFAGSCSSHVLLQNVYIREYLLDLLCEHLVDVIYYLNFISQKTIIELEPMWQKTGAHVMTQKYLCKVFLS